MMDLAQDKNFHFQMFLFFHKIYIFLYNEGLTCKIITILSLPVDLGILALCIMFGLNIIIFSFATLYFFLYKFSPLNLSIVYL